MLVLEIMACGEFAFYTGFLSYSTQLIFHIQRWQITDGGITYSGRAYSPNFLWMWPNAKIGVMGASQLSSVMSTIAQSTGKSQDTDLAARIERESDAVYSSARLWDDGVIPPAHTRRVLALGLQAALSSRGRGDGGKREAGRFGVFRM